MEDLFEREQQIYDAAAALAKEAENGAPCGKEEFSELVAEYGKILRLLRTITKISDRTTNNLNSSRQDLKSRAYYDALTGIHNRRYIDENLKRIAQNRTDGRSISVLMLDVDFFKNYNDLYGHGAGDKCLRAVARAIKESVIRSGDIVARYGGEEFLVILQSTGEKGARVIAEKILEKVRALAIVHENSEAADYVTLSIGATTGLAPHDLKGYINRSDEALYMSKQSGRDKYTFLGPREDR